MLLNFNRPVRLCPRAGDDGTLPRVVVYHVINEEMEEILSVQELLDPLEEAYREHGTGPAPDKPRECLYAPIERHKYWFNNIMVRYQGSVP